MTTLSVVTVEVARIRALELDLDVRELFLEFIERDTRTGHRPRRHSSAVLWFAATLEFVIGLACWSDFHR